MTNHPIRATGIAWFHREDYNLARKLFVDGDKLPVIFDDWLNQANRGIEILRSKGHIVEKVYIDLNTFPVWCRKHGLDINAHARMQFASAFVAAKYRNH